MLNLFCIALVNFQPCLPVSKFFSQVENSVLQFGAILFIPVTNFSVSDSAREKKLDIQSSDLPTEPLQVEFTEFSKQDKSGFDLTILTWHSFIL